MSVADVEEYLSYKLDQMKIYKITILIFKPGVHSWFFEIALVRMLVCVCMSAPEDINNQRHDKVWYRPCAIG